MELVLIISLLAALLLDAILIGFTATRQDRSRTIYLEALVCALFIYTLGYLIEVTCQSVEAIMAAIRVQNAGIPLIAPFFLFLVMGLFYPGHVKRWMPIAALVYDFTLFALILFNDAHHLYYTSVSLVDVAGSRFAVLDHGPLYMLQQAVNATVMLLVYFLLAKRFVKGKRRLREQMAYIVVGSLLAFVANILYMTGSFPPGLDPMPFALTLGLALFAIGMFHHRVMDISAISTGVAVETMDDGMIVLDEEWGFHRCNKSAAAIFPQLAGYQGGEDITLTEGWPRELLPRANPGQVNFILAAGPRVGKTYCASLSAISGGWDRHIGWTIILRDVSDMVSLLNQLGEMAITDPLTGIYNRRFFFQTVERDLLESARHEYPSELIMFDIDRFKTVNDTYGHTAGDAVLCALAVAVKKQLRPYDVFARYGGEEFVVFASHAKDVGGSTLAARLLTAISEIEVKYGNAVIRITASIGVVRVPPGSSLEKAMRAADAALYRAKSGGRNRVIEASIDEIDSSETWINQEVD